VTLRTRSDRYVRVPYSRILGWCKAEGARFSQEEWLTPGAVEVHHARTLALDAELGLRVKDDRHFVGLVPMSSAAHREHHRAEAAATPAPKPKAKRTPPAKR